MKRFLFWTLCLLAFSAAGPRGDQTAADQTGPPRPLFRAGVELVHLDVRVTDERGTPVEDLRADEIEVIEEGRARPIVLFQHIHEPRESPDEVARRTIAGEVSTNQGAPRGHLYVLVFDQQHITPGNEQRARLAAEHFLKTRMRPRDRVALHAVPGPWPQLAFTGNVGAVISELTRISGSLDRLMYGGLGPMRIHEAYEIARGNEIILNRVANRVAAETGAADVPSPLPTALQASRDASVSYFQTLVKEDARNMVARADQEARFFLLGLADLIRTLRRIEGRKSIILLSEGFHSDNVTRELEQVAASAAQSYSVVHALDLNRRELDLKENEPLGAGQSSEIQARLAPLGSLATETDGALFQDAGSRLDSVFGRIADQSQDYYLVGFEPPAEALTHRERYRRVKVRVKREGVRASTRTGYALRGERTPADRRLAIDAALGAPFAQQGLPVEYTTYVLRGSSPGMHRVVLVLTAHLPVGSRGAGGQPPPEADVVFAVRSMQDGRMAASGTGRVPLPEAARPGAATGTSAYRVQFEVPAGEYLMRAVVREADGLVGSADRHLRVPSLYGPGVTAGDLIVSSPHGDGLPVRTTAYVSDVLTGMVELYARVPDQLDGASVRIDLALRGGEQALRSTRAVLPAVDETTTGPKRSAQFELPLEGVAAGSYVMRAIVQAGDETIATLVRELEVLSGTPPRRQPMRTESPAAEQILRGEVARQYLEAVRREAPTPAIAEAARLGLAGDWTQAEAVIGEPMPDSLAFTHVLRGLARFAQHDLAGAAAALKEGFERERKDARAAFFLGWAAAMGGDDRQAISAWRSAAFLDARFVAAHLALADAYLRMARPELAEQAVRAGLTALPDSPELLDKLTRMVGSR